MLPGRPALCPGVSEGADAPRAAGRVPRSWWQLVPCNLLTTHQWVADTGGLVAVPRGCSTHRAGEGQVSAAV